MEQTAFEKMKASINRGITTVSMKTSTSVEKVKVNTHIETIEKEISKIQKEIGNKVYILWKADGFDIEKIREELEQIDERKTKIKELQEKLEELISHENEVLGSFEKNHICKCSNCGMEFDEQVRFCIKCGTKID